MPQFASKYCSSCRAQVRAVKNSPNHVVHGLITLFLCGLWLPVWIYLSLNAPYTCVTCGTIAHSGAERVIKFVFWMLTLPLLALLLFALWSQMSK